MSIQLVVSFVSVTPAIICLQMDLALVCGFTTVIISLQMRFVFRSDIDECLIENGGCSHQCINGIGSYVCICTNGYELSGDGKTCNG